jgi:GTP cyclohydrolase I
MTAEPAAGLPRHLAREGGGIDVDAASRAAADFLSALGIDVVVLEAEHSCMTLRGVRAHGAKTVTSALLGTLRADPRSRAEFFALAGVPS